MSEIKIKDRVKEIRKIKAGDLVANPRNWRLHPKAQQEAMTGVLRELGAADVLKAYYDTNGQLVLLDGHLRTEINPDFVWNVVIMDFTDAEADEYLATHDVITGMADIDADVLKNLLGRVTTKEPALAEMLAKLADSAGLTKPPPKDAEVQTDRAAELNEKWQVKSGDLWRIGEHRLLCGDSTKREDVERVMGGEKADMCFFDPPYGISFQSNGRTATKKFDKLEGDEIINADWLPIAVDLLSENGAMYICTRWDVYPEWRILVQQHIQIKNLVVWDKVDWSSGDLEGDYSPRHEFILYCVKGRHILRGHRESNVWSFGAQNKQDYLHPTQKKVEVPAFAISKSSDNGSVIADYFCGSGTTIVACQNLNRKCRAIEISPNYCAVILERMANAFPDIEIKKIETPG